MGLLLMFGAGVLGWKYGGLQPYRFGIIAVISAALVAFGLAVNRDIPLAGMWDPINIVFNFVVRFLTLAVPFAIGAWLKIRSVKSRTNPN
jgi:hypothetical protein